MGRASHHTRFSLKTLFLIALLSIVCQGYAAQEASQTPDKSGALPTPTLKEMLKATQDDAQDPPVEVPASAPYDEYNRGTPLGAIQGLSKAISEEDYERAMHYLDMRNVPKHIADKGTDLVRQLRIIADRTFWIDTNLISNDPLGHRDDGLPPYRDRAARIQTPDGPVDILLQRVPGDAKGVYIWKISNKTVSEIPGLYAQFGYGKIGDRLSHIIPEIDGAIIQPWQVILLVIIIAIAYAIAWLVTSLFNLIGAKEPTPGGLRRRRFIAGPMRFLILVLIYRANFDLIAPSLAARAIYEANTSLIVAFTWIIMGITHLAMGRLADRMIRHGNTNAMQILRPAARAIKGVIIFIAVMVWLDNMGFKISTLIAGLGVGSIAIALAAQKSIENLIGSITLYSAQPVRIGDLCRFGTTVGVVEEIGLRSTQVRTLARSLINIPNASFSALEIENISAREKILYQHTLGLSSATTADQMRRLLVELREMLQTHPRVEKETARVRFREFADHALNVEVFAYIETTDFNEYLEITEALHLGIMDRVAGAGTCLSLPAQRLYLEQTDRPGG